MRTKILSILLILLPAICHADPWGSTMAMPALWVLSAAVVLLLFAIYLLIASISLIKRRNSAAGIHKLRRAMGRWAIYAAMLSLPFWLIMMGEHSDEPMPADVMAMYIVIGAIYVVVIVLFFRNLMKIFFRQRPRSS